jgi:hypothetical protein
VFDLQADEVHQAKVVGHDATRGIPTAGDGNDLIRSETRFSDLPVQDATEAIELVPADVFVIHIDWSSPMMRLLYRGLPFTSRGDIPRHKINSFSLSL